MCGSGESYLSGKVGSHILWFFSWFSSAYAEMSCKKDYKLRKGECKMFREALLTFQFIDLYR